MAGIDSGYLTFNLQEHKNPYSVDYDDSILKPTTNEEAMVNTAANFDDNTYEEPVKQPSMFPLFVLKCSTHFPVN